MRYRILIGNMISFIALIAGLQSSHAKTAERTLFFNTIQSLLMTVCSIILGAWTGALVEIIAVPCNYLVNHGRFTKPFKVLFLTIIAGTTVYLTIQKSMLEGRFVWIELLTLISIIPYTWLIDEYEDVGLKLLTMSTAPVWVLYYILNHNYVSVASETINTLIAGFAAFHIWKENRFW